MRFIENMKISRTIMLITAVPMIAALIFASLLIFNEAKHNSNLTDLSELTALSVKMSNLVHEQQKERGATAVFLGSKGAKFKQELAAQRANTDVKRKELKDFLTGFEHDGYSATFTTKFEAVLATLGKMDSIRSAVDTLSISGPDAIGYYTGLNGQNLDTIGYMANLSDEPQIVSGFVAYTNFLQGKERAGIERAVGANGFASGRFSEKAMDRFKALINAQDTYNSIFLSYATDTQKKTYQEVMDGAPAREVKRIRAVALAGGLTGELAGISGKVWFDTITQKIEGLKKIENSLAADLLRSMESIQDAAFLLLIEEIALAIVTLLAVIALSFLVIRSFTGSVRSVVFSLTEIAEGNVDVELPPETKNEFGDMARATVALRQAVKEAFELGQMVEDMPMNVVMCNPEDFKVTYMNKAAIATLKSLEHLLPCKVDELVGNTIDIFYESPEHQRKILSDPDNLPHTANIELGDEHLSLKIYAIRDKSGGYAGPMLSWSVITDQMKISEKVAGVVKNVSAAATEMRSTAESMSATAEQTSRQASAVAAASEQATANVQTVASASEEMSASISEINRQVGQSSEIATKANAEAQRTNETVQSLVDAAQKIGEVVNLISEIAEQTNLLALNATIEAARAGEAGKGFAVVASEVKNLANQTAKATEEIGGKVTEMQTVTNDAVGAINVISDTIAEINSIAETISTAVGEQGAATQEISQNTQQAAAGTQEVSSNITGVTQAASETGAAAQQVLSAADELAKHGETLSADVDAFIAQVKAA